MDQPNINVFEEGKLRKGQPNSNKAVPRQIVFSSVIIKVFGIKLINTSSTYWIRIIEKNYQNHDFL